MNSGKKPLIVLAAGGTGGHLFPAQALAEELLRRGLRTQLMTDERVHDYGKAFPAEAIHVVPSATLSFSQPMKVPGRLWRLYSGYRLAKKLLGKNGADAVVGFGGYPSLPPLVAATHLGLATVVHEQNAVLGRANRLLARRVDRIGTSFETVCNIPQGLDAKFVFTGNPVRGAVIAKAAASYPALSDSSPLNILVFGGSQGARAFADLVPPALTRLPEALRKRLNITQQCRPEDMGRVRAAYDEAGIEANLDPFFADMPQRMANSHLVICRSGASSIAELCVVGRPAVLVPLPHAIDNDQLRNAQNFASGGAGWLMPQGEIESGGADQFAAFLSQLLSHHSRLREAATAALAQGKPMAALELANLVEHTLALRGRSAPGDLNS